MKKRAAPPILAADSRLIDSHCHLDMNEYHGNLDEIINTARQCGVTRIITIAIDLTSSCRVVELADRYPEVYATVGIHPHSAEDGGDVVYRKLQQLAAGPKVVGYGEIGLDYARQYAPVAVQRREFARQLNLAKELHLPVVIHDRDAHEDTLKILKQKGPFPAGA